MTHDTPARWVLIGAIVGAAAGVFVVGITWLLLPAPATSSAPTPPESLTAAGDHPAGESPASTPAPLEPTPTAAQAESLDAQKDREEIYQKLKKIGLALHQHHDVYRVFAPPMASPGNDKATQLSWRVHILPYLDQKALYDEFYLDEPWDSTHNRKLLEKMPDVFRIGISNEPTSRFQVFTGPRVVFGPGKSMTIRDITDGLANTIHVVVTGPDRAIPWTKPDELPLNEQDPLAALGSMPHGAFHCLMGDGLSLTLPANVVPEIVVALATPTGGEVVDAPSLRRGIGVKTKMASTTSGQPRASEPGKSAVSSTNPREPKLIEPTERPDLKETLRKLNQIALAMVRYSEKAGRLPYAGDPKSFKDEDRPKLSWRVLLLPYLQQQPLFDRFHLDEPWDSPNNLPLLDQMPEIYRSVTSEVNVTRMQVLYGDKMLFDRGKPKALLRDLTDGYDNTILVLQSGWDRAVPWTKPEDIAFDPNAPLGPLGSLGTDPILCATPFDKTLALPPDIDPKIFAALATPAGQEVVDSRPYLKQWHEVVANPTPVSVAARKRTRQMEKLNDIMRGLHKFHNTYHQFPPLDGRWRDPQGRPTLSWRVLILPFVDQGPLYNQFKMDEPWDSPNNRRLVDRMPDLFRDDDEPATSNTTRFVELTGPGTPFPGNSGFRMRDFRDGAHATILVIRVGKNKAVPWSKPEDAVFNPAAPLDALGTLDSSEELLFSMANSAVKRLKPDLPAELFKALVSPSGGESIDMDALDRSDYSAAAKSLPTASTKQPPPGRTNPPSNGGSRREPPPANAPAKQPAESLAAVASRAGAAARRGDWQTAADQFAHLLEVKPVDRMTAADHIHVYNYAPLLLKLDQQDQYFRLCRAVLDRFGDTTNPITAERTAKMCLLAPQDPELVATAAKLANRAVEQGQNEPYLTYFELAVALAKLREGRGQEALDWCEKSQAHNQSKADYISFHVAMTHLVRTLSYLSLKDITNARQSLRDAEQVIATKFPKLDSGDLGVSWFDWLMCDLLLREAQTQLKSAASPGNG